MMGQHEGKLCKKSHEEENNEWVGEGHQEGCPHIIPIRTAFVARLMDILRRITAPGIDAKDQQHDTADNLQVEAVAVIIDEIHDKGHTETCDSRINNIAGGCSDARHKSIPAPFVQRSLYTENADWSHGSRSHHTYEHALQDEVDDVNMYWKNHIVCKGTKIFGNLLLFLNIFVTLLPQINYITQKITDMNQQLTNKPYVIGLDLGGTNAVFGIVDQRGTIKATTAIKTQDYETATDFVDASVKALQVIIEQTGGIDNIRSMGIGAPNGNYYNGTVEMAPNLKWARDTKVPLAQMFSDRLGGLPTAITNDANAAAIGEMTYGVARGMKNFIVITLGTGVGSGIVVNGQLVYGSDGFAGELGHVTMVRGKEGRPCGCGRRGCLETYCSATGVARTAREWLSTTDRPSLLRDLKPENITSLEVSIAAGKGDELAREIYEFTGHMLGEACADFTTFCSPEAYIFFGGMVKAGDLLMKPIQKAYDEHVMTIFKGKAQFLVSALDGASAAVLGASAIGWSIQ